MTELVAATAATSAPSCAARRSTTSQVEDNDHGPHAAVASGAEDLVGNYVRLLDAFAYARFDLGDHALGAPRSAGRW